MDGNIASQFTHRQTWSDDRFTAIKERRWFAYYSPKVEPATMDVNPGSLGVLTIVKSHRSTISKEQRATRHERTSKMWILHKRLEEAICWLYGYGKL